MKNLSIQFAIVTCAALLVACQTTVPSAVCSSLVTSKDEAVCLLPASVAPRSIVGANFVDGGSETTLREKLESLPEPSGSHEDSGTTWFHFGKEGHLQASCKPTGSNDGVDQCFWHLRSVERVEASRISVFLEAKNGGFREGFIHLETPALGGSAESISLKVVDGVITEMDWFSPATAKDIAPKWFKSTTP